jgi:hypothetical protein
VIACFISLFSGGNMRIFLALILSTFSASVFSAESPTPAVPAEQSVLVENSAGNNVTDTHIRRRGLFRRGYVVVTHTVGNTVSTTREVLDDCCNVLRSRTVTKQCQDRYDCNK